MKIYFYISLLFFAILNNAIEAQIVRGFTANEIYLNTNWWYFTGLYTHAALFYSDDCGETIQVNYEYGNYPGAPLPLGGIFEDAQQGVLYNQPYYSTDFMISYDSGISWEIVEVLPPNGGFFGGKIPGEIFHYGFSSEGFLLKSVDFGQSFDTINSNVKYGFFVGVDSNTIYGISRISSDYNQYFIHYSYDNGYTFDDSLMIDTSFTGLGLEGIYRGANEGEIYLVSRWVPDHYKIFFSSDDGHSWQFRHKTIDINFWSFSFTPGAESGAFYMARMNLDITGTYTLLYIDYSVDTAKTFTTFYHELTPEVGISEQGMGLVTQHLICTPNPAIDFLSINNLETFITGKCKNSLEIYSMSGVKLEEIIISHQGEVEINTSAYPSGVYVAVLKSDNHLLATKKFVVQR